jgi:hypothetical protein
MIPRESTSGLPADEVLSACSTQRGPTVLQLLKQDIVTLLSLEHGGVIGSGTFLQFTSHKFITRSELTKTYDSILWVFNFLMILCWMMTSDAMTRNRISARKMESSYNSSYSSQKHNSKCCLIIFCGQSTQRNETQPLQTLINLRNNMAACKTDSSYSSGWI